MNYYVPKCKTIDLCIIGSPGYKSNIILVCILSIPPKFEAPHCSTFIKGRPHIHEQKCCIHGYRVAKLPLMVGLTHMWQSQIEIEYYSVTYFERVTKLTRYSAELPLRAGLIHDV